MVANGEIEAHGSHLDIVLNCMAEILFTPKGPYKINGTPDYPISSLQAAYKTIRMEEVVYALEAVYKRKTSLEHPLAFYRTTLFNAALQGRAYTDSKKTAKNNQPAEPHARQMDDDEVAAIRQMLSQGEQAEG